MILRGASQQARAGLGGAAAEENRGSAEARKFEARNRDSGEWAVRLCFLCAYICLFIYLYLFIQLFLYIYIHIYVLGRQNVFSVYTYVCTHISIYIYVHVHVHVYVYVYVHVYVYVYVYVYTSMYIHLCI